MTRTRNEENEEEKGIMTKRRGGHRNKGVRALDSGDGCKRTSGTHAQDHTHRRRKREKKEGNMRRQDEKA